MPFNGHVTYHNDESVSYTPYVLFVGGIAPNITSWGNTQTNDQSLDLTLAPLGSITFNATADQSINTWNWTINGNDQNNNDDELMAVFSDGTYTLSVNATNANGTSNTVTWNLTVIGYDATALFWSSSSSGYPTITSTYRGVTDYIFFAHNNASLAYDYNISYLYPNGSYFYNLSVNNITYGYASWYIPSDITTGLWSFRYTKRNYVNNTLIELANTTLNIMAGSANSSYVHGFVFTSGTTTGIQGVTVSMGGYSTTTNLAGYYNLTGVTDGNYVLSASKSGYQQSFYNLTVSGGSISHDFSLIPYSTATAKPTYNGTLREKPITGDNEIGTNFWNLLFLIVVLIIFGYFSVIGDRR